MAINPITAKLGVAHVTSYDMRKLVASTGGWQPRRLLIENGSGLGNFGVSINEEDSSYFDVDQGVINAGGYVISNDNIISTKVGPTGTQRYMKATVYIKFSTNETTGIDSAELKIAYSENGTTAGSISYPVMSNFGNESFVIDDVLPPDIELAHLLLYDSAIQSVETILPLWSGRTFYGPGDEIDLSYMIAAGYIAANSQNVYFFVPFNKDVCGVTGATLSGTVTLRHADGGFIGSSSGQALSDLGTVTVYIYPTGAYIRCVLTNAATYSNQSVIAAHLASGSKLTFN